MGSRFTKYVAVLTVSDQFSSDIVHMTFSKRVLFIPSAFPFVWRIWGTVTWGESTRTHIRVREMPSRSAPTDNIWIYAVENDTVHNPILLLKISTELQQQEETIRCDGNMDTVKTHYSNSD